MRKAFKHLFSSITLFALILSTGTLAEDFRGEIVGVDGCVHIINADGDRKAVEQTGLVVRESDTVVTDAGANAVIRFDDGVLSVLDEKSRLRVEKTSWLSHLGGRIYFAYRKVFNGERQITTRFATLGIRGTTFIVYDDDDGQSVALQEGVLDIESQGPAFEMYRRQQIDEFEAYRQEVQQGKQAVRDEFDQYKKELSQEYVEYLNSFTMEPNYIVRFDGTQVSDSLIDEEVEADFENFEAIAGELLEEFRIKAQSHREQLQNQQLLDEDDFYE